MSWLAVKSSQVHSIRYDPIDQTMDVRYACGSCQSKGTNGAGSCPKCGGMGHSSEYRYQDVPAEVHAMVRDSPSVGSALNTFVKQGKHTDPPQPFKFTRVR